VNRPHDVVGTTPSGNLGTRGRVPCSSGLPPPSPRRAIEVHSRGSTSMPSATPPKAHHRAAIFPRVFSADYSRRPAGTARRHYAYECAGLLERDGRGSSGAATGARSTHTRFATGLHPAPLRRRPGPDRPGDPRSRLAGDDPAGLRARANGVGESGNRGARRRLVPQVRTWGGTNRLWYGACSPRCELSSALGGCRRSEAPTHKSRRSLLPYGWSSRFLGATIRAHDVACGEPRHRNAVDRGEGEASGCDDAEPLRNDFMKTRDVQSGGSGKGNRRRVRG
jgi:hypothetical protein